MSEENSRRKFLRNVSLAGVAAAVAPTTLGATSSKSNESVACDETTLDYYGEGPFYTANAPILKGNNMATGHQGTPITISGRVMNIDCTEFIPFAEIDIWHADDNGAYDNSGFNFRGRIFSDSQGFYSFETIWPGKYLNGSKFRPAHIHFKISATGFPPLTTQLYFQGDTSIAGDAAASLTSGQYDAQHRIIPLVQNSQGGYDGTWEVVIDAQGTPLGIGDLHIDKGIIYSASPNPFFDKVDIHFGVFKAAKIGLVIFDMMGKEVANLKDEELSPEKYGATWHPDVNLPVGTYFLALKVNDLQVHYLKLTKAGSSY